MDEKKKKPFDFPQYNRLSGRGTMTKVPCLEEWMAEIEADEPDQVELAEARHVLDHDPDWSIDKETPDPTDLQ